MRKEKIRIKGYAGSYYVIDEKECDGEKLYLLESEQYGDEAPGLIVDGQLNVIVDEVWNGWLDYNEWKEGDCSPSNPWDTLGMSISDFIGESGWAVLMSL